MASITLKNAPDDLAIRSREFVVLAGAGSSAIVRLIAGLENISQGEVLFDERRINDSAPHERDVGLVSHDYVPYPGLSVFENLAIGLRGRKFAEAEIKKRIAAVASALDLEGELQASAEWLSSERRSLVGLGRALGQGMHSNTVLVRLNTPVPGTAYIGAFPCGGEMAQVYMAIYLYGESAKAVTTRDEPAWQSWIDEQFPMPQMG